MPISVNAKSLGGWKNETIDGDTISSNLAGVLFIERKTGRKVRDFSGDDQDEKEIVVAFAPGNWREARKILSEEEKNAEEENGKEVPF